MGDNQPIQNPSNFAGWRFTGSKKYSRSTDASNQRGQLTSDISSCTNRAQKVPRLSLLAERNPFESSFSKALPSRSRQPWQFQGNINKKLFAESQSLKRQLVPSEPRPVLQEPKEKSPKSSSPQKKRARKSQKPIPEPSPKTPVEPSENEKRALFLERNRQAALKCRQRKKQWLNNLQEKVEYLSEDNRLLQIETAQLKDEIMHLKELLAVHKCQSTIE
ncbi:hypothetical protein CLU79DRAFT_836675 [Phycomyces nitens]|nr:hypothetical protein CLU79DRAFT_836675 [Phycomyces nitens]